VRNIVQNEYSIALKVSNIETISSLKASGMARIRTRNKERQSIPVKPETDMPGQENHIYSNSKAGKKFKLIL
jgi:hypothetical protein